jgi:DNA-binding NarL/FixJ family response regulator
VDQEGTPGAPLTAEEEQVLQLLVQGHTGTEMAAELTVSSETVRRNVQNILVKLGVQARLEAAVRRFRPPDAPPRPPDEAV